MFGVSIGNSVGVVVGVGVGVAGIAFVMVSLTQTLLLVVFWGF
jgi:hypothetical protein